MPEKGRGETQGRDTGIMGRSRTVRNVNEERAAARETQDVCLGNVRTTCEVDISRARYACDSLPKYFMPYNM